jgi:vancomycin permeability regulator SanA
VLGVASVGMVADRRVYQTYRWWQLREVVATAAAWWDVNIGHPVPVLGDKLPIEVNQGEQAEVMIYLWALTYSRQAFPRGVIWRV